MMNIDLNVLSRTNRPHSICSFIREIASICGCVAFIFAEPIASRSLFLRTMMTLWIVAVVFLALNTSILSQNIRPNHVAINEERKHIDVDSSWLDKTGQEIQQV